MKVELRELRGLSGVGVRPVRIEDFDRRAEVEEVCAVGGGGDGELRFGVGVRCGGRGGEVGGREVDRGLVGSFGAEGVGGAVEVVPVEGAREAVVAEGGRGEVGGGGAREEGCAVVFVGERGAEEGDEGEEAGHCLFVCLSGGVRVLVGT